MRTLDFSGLASPPRVSVLGETASVFYARHWLNQIGIETSTAEDSQVIVEAGRPAGPSPLDPPMNSHGTYVVLHGVQLVYSASENEAPPPPTTNPTVFKNLQGFH